MAEIALATTVVDPKDRSNTASGYTDVVVPVASTTGATVINYAVSPVSGVVKEAWFVGSVTSDGTATYTIDIDNVTGTDKAIVNAEVFDADPVLTADTYETLTLSTTAANLVVAKGDALKFTVAGGTGAGQGAFLLRIEEQ